MTAELTTDTRYSVASYPGIAWHYTGPETAPDCDTEWTGIEEPTGRVVMVMVGDDRPFTFEPDECAPLADTDYCAECGQVGCAADGKER